MAEYSLIIQHQKTNNKKTLKVHIKTFVICNDFKEIKETKSPGTGYVQLYTLHVWFYTNP